MAEKENEEAFWGNLNILDLFFFFFFFFGCAHGTWKFPNHGMNPCHSNDPSCCSDNAESLTCCATREPIMDLDCLFATVKILELKGQDLCIILLYAEDTSVKKNSVVKENFYLDTYFFIAVINIIFFLLYFLTGASNFMSVHQTLGK